MHPLKHPRNAIFVGLVFVAIAIVYWAIPVLWRLSPRLRRDDDARHPRDRDVADVLRAHRRLAERLRPRADGADLERDPRVHLPVRHSRLGRAHLAAARLHGDHRRRVLRPGRDPVTPRPGRNGFARPRSAPVTPAGVHMPGPTFAPFFAAIGTLPAVLRARVRGPVDLWGSSRCSSRSSTGVARRSSTTTTSPASTPSRRPSSTRARRPGSISPAHRSGHSSPRWRSRSSSPASCSVAGSWVSGCSSRS